MKSEQDMRQMIIDRASETSQAEVARQLGRTAAYVSQLVKGDRHISRQIAKQLGYRVIVTKLTVREYEEI